MSKLIVYLGGRRFILTVGCGLFTTMLTWYGKIDSGTYSTVIIATVGAYIAGNTYQKTKSTTKEQADA